MRRTRVEQGARLGQAAAGLDGVRWGFGRGESNTWPQRGLHTRTTVVSSPSEQESSEPVGDSGPESTRWVTIIAVNPALPIAVGQEMF